MALHATVDRLRRDLRAMPPNERRQVLVQLSTLTRQELGGGGAQEEPPATAAAAPSPTSPLQLLCGPRRGLPSPRRRSFCSSALRACCEPPTATAHATIMDANR